MSVKKRIEHLEKLTNEQSSKKDFNDYVVQFISCPREFYEYEGKRVTIEEYKRLIVAKYEIQNKEVMFVVFHAAEGQLVNRKSDQV